MPKQYRVWGLLTLLAMLLLLGTSGQAQSPYDASNYEQTMNQMIETGISILRFEGGDLAVFRAVQESGDPLYIAPLIDLGYFMSRDATTQEMILATLEELTGQPMTIGWRGYFEWASANDIALPPNYADFKGNLFGIFIDPQFRRFFQPGTQESARVNLLEAVWGGVRVDGIPSLVNARQITPEAAAQEGVELTQFCRGDDCSYPAGDELVFGVYLDGDARAYPLRLLNWHEMFNDVIGQSPMRDTPDGDIVCNFRAPTVFRAIARSADKVLINGYSAGCPDEGWLSADALEWVDSDWDTVENALPDIESEAALDSEDSGIEGRVIGRPVMLAYCTLCGSGILFDATIENLSYVDSAGETVEMGDVVLEFGSTGMLMRSNKLMYDRDTDTVWNALTGEPAFGALANSDVLLDLLPVVVTDWATWLEEHPNSSVLSLDTGYRRNYTNGAAYSDYFNNPEFVMFPVFQQDETLIDNKDMIFGLHLNGVDKAYSLEILIGEQVTNDSLGETDIVIISRATPDREFF
ncbi:MAG: DUF3179 domain-containing (seleno)protein [Anaerolineae bacterium]|nr:DUF3179 domain-containing (seleno)protein [Anaerolineae bacterium]